MADRREATDRAGRARRPVKGRERPSAPRLLSANRHAAGRRQRPEAPPTGGVVKVIGSAFALRFPSPRRLIASELARDVGTTLAVRLVSVAAGTGVTIAVARALGPSNRGLFAVAGTIGATGIAFGNFGLQSSNTYYVSRDRRLLPGLAANSAVISLLVVPALSLCVWFLFLIFPAEAPVHGTLLALAMLGVPLGLAYLLFQNLLLGLQDFRGFNTIDLITRFAGLGLLVGVLAAGERRVPALFAAALFPSAAGATWAWLRARGRVDTPPRPSIALLRRTLAYGMRAYLGAFFAFMLLRSDLLIVKYELGSERAGYYSVAVNMADVLYILPTVVGMVTFPRLAATSDPAARRQLAVRMTVALTALMCISGGIAAAIARQGLGFLFGQAYVLRLLLS